MKASLSLAIIAGAVALVLGAVDWSIYSKERIKTNGERIYLQLAPVDPRSLMQGDYMRLDYAVAREHAWGNAGRPHDGHLVLALDANGVGTFVRFHEPGSELGPGEFLLRYRLRDGRVRLGADAFFFQEGHADRFAHAKYGELRVTSNGSSVLVGLRDGKRVPLGEGAPEPVPAPEATVREEATAPVPSATP